MFKMKQRTALFKGGLNKKYAYPMCALLLSHNHGINQRNEQIINGDLTNTLSFIIQNVDGSSKDLIDESDCRD